MRLDDNLAAPRGVIRLGGKEYLVSQPTDKDMQTVQQYLSIFSGKKQKTWLQRLTGDPGWAALTGDQQSMLLKDAAAAKRSGELDIDAAEIMQTLSSPECTRFLAWLLLRKEYPDVDKARDIDPHITAENSETVFILLDEASGMSSVGNSGGRSGSVKG